MKYTDLDKWHAAILTKLMGNEFPGRSGLLHQMTNAEFSVIDQNRSLRITHGAQVQPAATVRTIPVEAHATDEDGVEIHALLYTRRGTAYMLELLREDGAMIKKHPPVDRFIIGG